MAPRAARSVSRAQKEAFVKHFILFYDVVPDYVERRGAFRAEHLEKAWASHDRGELVLGGALADPPDGAVLIFKADSPDVVRRLN